MRCETVSLVCIFVVKFLVEKKKYVSSYNFLLLLLIFALSVNGLLMKAVYHPDIVSVKTFVMGIVTFGVGAVPASAMINHKNQIRITDIMELTGSLLERVNK